MRRVLLLALLVSGPLAGPAMAKPKGDPAPTAAAAAPAAPVAKPIDPAKLEKARAEAFTEYDTQLASGQKARAADALVALVENPAQAAFHAEAYGKLGDLFLGLDLPYAAVTAWTRAFSAADDTNVAEIGLFVPKAIATAKKVGDSAILEEPFSKNLGLARTEDVRGEMAFLAAREAFHDDSFGLGLGMLKMVKEGDPIYPDAKALEGVIMNQQGRPEDALKPFEAAQNAGRDKDIRFKDSVTLNMARSYYAAGNYPRAIQGYAGVSRGSEFWPQAQFERAWSHFRIDDLNGTLGVLYSLDTPFFSTWYFPEADLLRIYAMFLMCKFPEANTEIEAFRTFYKPIHQSLQGWNGKSDKDTFELARRYAESGKYDPLPEAILRPFATEDRLLSSIAAVKSADDELERLKAVSANPFSETARRWVTERRDAMVDAEGARIGARIAEQEAQVGQMLDDTEIFILDILRMKGLLYQQAAAIGKMPDAARVVKREERVRKGWREWPYEGEIWADELGYYRVDAAPECPAGLARGQK
jgi:tetratricopeptide (TPR) repeat protein